MCINKKRIYNKWSKQWLYVDCGHCPACQQVKAFKRTKRIKNASHAGYINLFVTLTYSNECIPYIRKSELKNNVSTINIYRDTDYRFVRVNSNYSTVCRPVKRDCPLAVVDCDQARIFVDAEQRRQLRYIKNDKTKDRVSVCYYRDVQNFIKRFRTNLIRHYKVHEPVKAYSCSELGPSTQRAHFHLLLDVPATYLDECKSAIIESWPYDRQIAYNPKSIQIAHNAASYCSAYVNRSADFPKLFEARPFRPKHTFSKFYGFENANFSLGKICDAIRSGDLRYNTLRLRDGVAEAAFVLYPKYVLDRYFRKFKGYSRLSFDTLHDILSAPSILRLSQYEDVVLNRLVCVCDDGSIDLEQVDSIICSINLRYSRFINEFPIFEDGKLISVGLPDNSYSRCLFADYFIKCWIVFSSTLVKSSHELCVSDEDHFQLFDNWDFDNTKYHYLHDLVVKIGTDPNLYLNNIISSLSMEDIFHRVYKRRKVTGKVLSEQGYNF